MINYILSSAVLICYIAIPIMLIVFGAISIYNHIKCKYQMEKWINDTMNRDEPNDRQ